MTETVIKSQMLRVTSNYIRMILGFIIGLVIIRELTSLENGVYSTYSLVVIGLGFGVMLREVVRAAIVPFIGLAADEKDNPYNYNKCISISLMACALYVIILMLVVSAKSFFDVNENFVDSFVAFVLLRGGAQILIIMQTPALNVFAVNGNMGGYNGYLFLERVGELLAVEMAVYSAYVGEIDWALLVNGITSVVWNMMLLVLVSGSVKKYSNKLNFRAGSLSKNDWSFISSQIYGNVLLVLNMALYFRFSIILINALFGETFSSVYALSTQLIGYLRQVVMGLVTGIDSVFSRLIKQQKKKSVEKRLFVFGEVNSIAAILVAVVMIVALPHLVDKFVHGDLSLYRDDIVILTKILLFGVLARTMSEHWMAYMSGVGKVLMFSKFIFVVSLTTPVVILFVWIMGAQEPLVVIAYQYLVAMVVSHLIIVPIVMKCCADISIKDSYQRIVQRSILYTGLILFSYMYYSDDRAFSNDFIVLLISILVFGVLLVDTTISYRKILKLS